MAREVGLAGRTSLECAQADEVVDAVVDLNNAGAQAIFSKVKILVIISVSLNLLSQDEEKIKKFQTETLPAGLACLEKRLCARGGQFMAGNCLTWADIMLFSFVSGLPSQDALAKCPKVKNLCSRVGNLPNIKCWVEKRPVTNM